MEIEIDEIFGLPAHPLLVHIPVVLIPTALVVLVIALWPAARRPALIGAAGMAAVGAIGTVLAVGAGEQLQDRVRETERVEEHAEQGEQAELPAIAFGILAVGTAAAAETARRRSERTGSTDLATPGGAAAGRAHPVGPGARRRHPTGSAPQRPEPAPRRPAGPLPAGGRLRHLHGGRRRPQRRRSDLARHPRHRLRRRRLTGGSAFWRGERGAHGPESGRVASGGGSKVPGGGAGSTLPARWWAGARCGHRLDLRTRRPRWP